MKFFKKAISALLASVMCIPSGIINIANATETETDPANGYTVTLTDSANGIMQFSEECMENSTASQDGYHMVQVNENGELVEVENDGSIWSFMTGDNVEIELIPDTGYKVSSFTIKNASTGKTMAHKETEDNMFSFTMPSKSVTIEAVFAQSYSISDGEENVEDTNIISENSNGDTIYQRIELVDDEAIDLQERINSLPVPDDLYYDLFGGEDEKVIAVEEEANKIGEIYFNEFTDEQRAQIDPSLLFSTLLILRASDNVTTSDLEVTEDGLKELQGRIDALYSPNEVTTIAEFVEDEEYALSYVTYEYSNDDADMLITNKSQDELFLEVLDLSTTVFSLNFDQRMELNITALEDMYRYFTMGHGENAVDEETIASLSQLFTTTYADDTKGRYNHTYNPAYNSSYFVGTLDGDTDALTMYCGNANVATFTHNGIPVNFSGAQEMLAGDTTLTIQMARAILYYGYTGPGQAEGIDTISPLSNPNGESASCEGQTISGEDFQKYMVTHFTLSYAWSGNVGYAPEKAPEYIKFYDLCYEKRMDVPDDFHCWLIVPEGRYQPIFYFKYPDGKVFKRRDPFNIWLYKYNSQPGQEYTGATLAGAEYTITYYKAEDNDDGTTKMDSFIESYNDALSTSKVPTATFTFETKEITQNGAGSAAFKALGLQFQEMFGPVAGIECAPIDATADYWTNQFLTSSPDDYNEYFGGSGSYLIRETRAPQGFDLSGQMSVLKSDGAGGSLEAYKTTNLQSGIVISLAREMGPSGLETVYYLNGPINGTKLPSKERIDFHYYNELGEKVDFSADLEDNSLLFVEENRDKPRLWTSAISVDTGTQWVDPNNSNIYLEDTVHVQTLQSKEAKYVVDTRLYDITANEFVSFNNGYGATSTPGGEIPDGWSNTYHGGDVSNGIITTTFNTRTTVEAGQTYTFKVRATIDGSTRKGHTLIFTNVCTVYNGYNGGIDIPGTNPATDILYILPLNKIDTDRIMYEPTTTNVLTCGQYQGVGGHTHTSSCYTPTASQRQLTEIETSIQDTAEMIYLTESSTSILSSQTQRKGPEGQSIIYAGMYSDDSFTTGHGTIKQTLTDTINYSNLQPNRTYYVKGYLMDKATGNYAVDANGTPIQNTQNTIQQQSSDTGDGTWQIQYSFDATGCGNKIYVSYVEVYLSDELVLEYKNIDDMQESFYIPEITTKLWDHKTGIDVTYAEESVTIHDTITYKKLLPNTSYKVETTFYNMATGEVLLDVNENPVIRETYFDGGSGEGHKPKISKEDGELVIDVEFPAVIKNEKGDIVKSIAGTIFVAYEKVYIEQGSEGSGKWVLVADHEEFFDKNPKVV